MEESKTLNKRIYSLLDNQEFDKALDELDSQTLLFVEIENDDLYLLAEIAGCYITLGNESFNSEAVNQGLKILLDNKEFLVDYITESSIDYNLGNAYSALYKISTQNESDYFPRPENVKGQLFDAKQAFLKSFKAIDIINLDDFSVQVLTNLGNNLNQSGRIVEALQYFDMVLAFNSDFPQAIASKADALMYMINATNCALTISLVAEIHNLYLMASKSEIHLIEINDSMKAGLEWSKEFLVEHNVDVERIPEEMEENKREYENHDEETKFYLDNFLNLSEHGLYCKCNGARIDSLTIGYPGFITADKKLIQLELLLNRLKSEFSMSRNLYYSYRNENSEDKVHYEDLSFDILNGLDYEKVRTSFRLCFGIFDKIAEGLCYMFNLTVGKKENIYFENFWQHDRKSSDRWNEINSFNNIHLTALFSIACDLNKKNGEFGFYKTWRNRLEHGVLSITKENTKLPELDSLFSTYTNEEEFNQKSLHLLQLTRSAIFSFVFCIREELVD